MFGGDEGSERYDLWACFLLDLCYGLVEGAADVSFV